MTPPTYAPTVVLAPLPTTISPSRIATFTDCPRMFQYQAIERLEQPPTVWTLKGTLVHAALESLFWRDPAERTLDAALAALDEATMLDEIVEGYNVLELDDAARGEFRADAATLVRHYFDLEDPRDVDAVGVELRVATSLAGATGGAPLGSGASSTGSTEKTTAAWSSSTTDGARPRAGLRAREDGRGRDLRAPL